MLPQKISCKLWNLNCSQEYRFINIRKRIVHTEIHQIEKSDIMFRPYLVVSHFLWRSKFYKVVNHCVSQRFLQAVNPAPALPRILPPSSLFSEKMARYVILSLSGITLVANNYDETQITSKVLKAIKYGNVLEVSRLIKSRAWDPNKRCEIIRIL